MTTTARTAALAAALAAGIAALPSQAAATLNWDFTYTGNGVSASGVFETANSADSNGDYTVTGITGTRNGNPIAGLIPAGSFLGNENLLDPASPYVSFGGIGFVSNGVNYVLSFTAGGCPGTTFEATSEDCGGVPVELVVSRAAQGVPEPLSVALLGAGLLGLAAARRARRSGADA